MRLNVRGAYPADWRAVAEAVKDAAGWSCVRCGHSFTTPAEERAAAEAAGGRISIRRGGAKLCERVCYERGRCQQFAKGRRLNYGVHHLDGDKGNCAWWNLIPLCNACHLSVQARVIPERPYLWEHSDWFRPYVCGFYASFYAGLEITRAQADADAAQWLTLGQPWRATA